MASNRPPSTTALSAPVRCSECDKSFSRSSSVIRHTRAVHTRGVQRFTCTECDRTFSRKEYLDRHRRSFHGGWKATCPICLHSFRPDYISVHRHRCWKKFRRDRDKTLSAVLRRGDTGWQDSSKPLTLKWSARSAEDREQRSKHQGPLAPATPGDLSVKASIYSSEYTESILLYGRAMSAIKLNDRQHLEEFILDLGGFGFDLSDLQATVDSLDSATCDPLLILAAKSLSYDIVECLSPRYIDANQTDRKKMTALHYAKDLRMVQALLRAGAAVDVVGWSEDGSLITPLEEAVKDRDAARAEALVKAGASVGLVSGMKDAIRAQDDEVFDVLLRAKLHLDAEPAAMLIMLEKAVQQGTANMVRRLLEVQMGDPDGYWVVREDLRTGLFHAIVAVVDKYHGSEANASFLDDAMKNTLLLGLKKLLPLIGSTNAEHNTPAVGSSRQVTLSRDTIEDVQFSTKLGHRLGDDASLAGCR